jgi:hypothetical protein
MAPSVRKGCAFPAFVFIVEAAPMVNIGGIASIIFNASGKAKPFRTEGGEAARAINQNKSSVPFTSFT